MHGRLAALLDTMGPGHARVAALATAHPGPTLTAATLAALADTTPAAAREVLATLVAAGAADERRTATEQAPARYALAGQARPALAARADPDDVDRALDRLAEHYRLRAAAADAQLNPWRWRADEDGAARARTAQEHDGAPWFADEGAALGWVAAELAALAALATRLAEDGHPAPWWLADHLATALVALKPWEVMAALYPLGLAAAQDEGHQVATALMLQRVATVTDDPGARKRHLDRALILYTAAGHHPGMASALQTLGDHAAQTQELTRAEGLYRESIDAHRQIGRARGAAISERKLGEVLADQGRLVDALELFTRARATLTGLPDADLYQAGRCAQAAAAALLDGEPDPDTLKATEDMLRRSLADAARGGRIHQQAGMHHQLSRIAARRGDTAAARAERPLCDAERRGGP